MYASQTQQHLGLNSSAPRDVLPCIKPLPVHTVFESTVRSVRWSLLRLVVLASTCGPCFDLRSLLRLVVLALTCGPCFDLRSLLRLVVIASTCGPCSDLWSLLRLVVLSRNCLLLMFDVHSRPFPLVKTIFVVHFAVTLNNIHPVRHFENGSAVEIVLCPKSPQIIINKPENYSRRNLFSLTR